MGLSPAPYFTTKDMLIVEKEIRGDRKHTMNVFGWERVVLNTYREVNVMIQQGLGCSRCVQMEKLLQNFSRILMTRDIQHLHNGKARRLQNVFILSYVTWGYRMQLGKELILACLRGNGRGPSFSQYRDIVEQSTTLCQRQIIGIIITSTLSSSSSVYFTTLQHKFHYLN